MTTRDRVVIGTCQQCSGPIIAKPHRKQRFCGVACMTRWQQTKATGNTDPTEAEVWAMAAAMRANWSAARLAANERVEEVTFGTAYTCGRAGSRGLFELV